MTDQETVDMIEFSELIRNIADALERLANITKACDDALGEMLEGDQKGIPSRDLLQNVDLINQSTQCVAMLLTNLLRADLPNFFLSSSNLTEGVFLQDIKNAGYSAECERNPASGGTDYF